ncbi:MFS transporter [Nocardioides sp. HM23]|uniref:MFS transporter n=1 Tax=Nocardioides bizhenqiangii TaxID=3095076 RepID=UPI002ACA16C6|nr:MFS transporter [Nocardioides sp. HM23]MDZ5620918.1 MFS transporter [Nocardioides sp. HM23]
MRRRRPVRRARRQRGRLLRRRRAGGAHDRGSGDVLSAPPRGVLAALCITVTISYGTLYYGFAVLAPTITADTGWSLTAITAAFSLGLLMTGLVGVVVGRSIQSRGPRGAMVVGAVVGAAGLALVASAPSYPWFVAAMLLCGAGAAGLFYAPAFAALTHWYGAGRVRALTTLTLVAGFASTVFAPLTTAIAEQTSWRTTYVVFAVLLLVVAVPVHWVALRHPWPAVAGGADVTPDREVIRSPAFVLSAAGATLTTLAMFAALVALIPLLVGRGMTPILAAWALGLGGAGQVLGRLAFPRLTDVTDVRQRVLWGTIAMALTTLALALVPGPALLLIGVSIVAGAARGLYTLVGATLVTDLWGPERYAAINGVLGAPVSVATALGPFAGAGIAAVTGSYPETFAVLAGLAAVGSLLSVQAVRRAPRPSVVAGR